MLAHGWQTIPEKGRGQARWTIYNFGWHQPYLWNERPIVSCAVDGQCGHQFTHTDRRHLCTTRWAVCQRQWRLVTRTNRNQTSLTVSMQHNWHQLGIWRLTIVSFMKTQTQTFASQNFPLRLNSCSSDSKTNLPKYTTLHSTPPTVLETLASSLTNILLSLTKLLLSPKLVTITFVNFAVFGLTLIRQLSVPLLPLSFWLL